MSKKQTTHQETKTKLSSATPNRDKTIHCQRKHRKSIPPAMPQRNQHLTHAMLRKPATTTPNNSKQYGKDWRQDRSASNEDFSSFDLRKTIIKNARTTPMVELLMHCAHAETFFKRKFEAAQMGATQAIPSSPIHLGLRRPLQCGFDALRPECFA